MPRDPFRRFQLVVLTLTHFLVDMYGGFFAPLIPALSRHLGLEIAILAMLSAAGGIVVNGIQPLMGSVMHRRHYPSFLVWGPLLSMLIVGIAYARGIGALGLVLLLSYVGIGGFHPEGLMAAHAVAEEDEHVSVPVFLSGGFFGYSVGALLATAWVDRFGFDTFLFLIIPGVAIMLLYPFSGLTRLVCHETTTTAGEKADPHAPSFWPLLLLGSLLATTATLLYTFYTTYLDLLLGRRGMVLGGQALFLLGLTSALSSYGWGYLSRRIHTFAIVAIGQFLCIPVYVLFLHAQTAAAVMALSIPLGALMGFYPLVATRARRARGLTPGLRSGLIVGGTWLLAAFPVFICSWLIGRGVALRDLLLACVAALGAGGILAFGLYLRTRGRSGSAQPVAIREDKA